MARLQWRVQNFSAGMHTEPGRLPADRREDFAFSAAGVRADYNGHLRQRVAFKRFGDTRDVAVTGVAAGKDYLLTLRVDASLSIRFADDPEEERLIRFGTPSNLTGILSLVSDFDDFIIVKAQGGLPFWIDMRPESNSYLYANRLGIEPPPVLSSIGAGDTRTLTGDARFYDEDGENLAYEPVIKPNFLYFYRITYARAIGDSAAAVRDNKLRDQVFLFSGMESNPSEAIGIYTAKSPGNRQLPDGGSVPLPVPDLTVDVVDSVGNPVRFVANIGVRTGYVRDEVRPQPVEVSIPFNILTFHDLQHSRDPQVTGIMLYQSEPVSIDTQGQINVDALEYRRIAYVPRAWIGADGEVVYGTEVTTQQPATEENWPNQPTLRFDNDVMPETERIHLYHDRIYVPTEEGLQFSDIDDTQPRLWAFPKVNAIRRAGTVDLVSHRGALLFGGPADFHSLTGTSAHDFEINRLGSLGPVSSHAMQVLRDTVAFVGASGFFGTNGVEVQKLSDALNGEFEGYETTAGYCHQLPDDSLVFSVFQTHHTAQTRRATFHFDGGWFAWPRYNLRQLAQWRIRGQKVLMADESTTVREVEWEVLPDVADDDAKDAHDLIDWHWESQRLNFGDEKLKSFRELQIVGQALSVVPLADVRWHLTQGKPTVMSSQGWQLNGRVFGVNGRVWGVAEVASPVRLTVWVDDKPPSYYVFELRRDDVRPVRIPVNRKGKFIRFRLEGRGHVAIQSLTLLGSM